MISQAFLKYFGSILNLLAYTHTLPFSFDVKTNKMVVSASNSQVKRLKVLTGISLLYGLYSAYRLMTEIQNSLNDYLGLTVVTVWTLVYFWTLVLQLCHQTKKDDMAWMFNQIVHIDATLQEKVGKDNSRIPEAIMVICVYMNVLAILMWTTIFYFTATKIGYLYSLVPVEYQGQAVFMIFLTFELYSKCQACSTVLWDLMFFILTTTVSCYWIHRILSLKKPMKLKIQDYKFMNILSQYINASNSTVKFPMILGIVFTLLCIGIYGAVRLFGEIGAQVYLCFPIIINNCIGISLLILISAAKQHKLSVEYLDGIKHLGDLRLIPSRETRREMKSLKAFGITFGIFGMAKYSYAAQYIMALSNISLSLLVAFPNAK